MSQMVEVNPSLHLRRPASLVLVRGDADDHINIDDVAARF